MANDHRASVPPASNGGRVPAYGSDVVVDVLHDLGIEYAAFNPGSSFRGIHDSLINYGGNRLPEIIECCHEEISVAIAHGYAKASGKPMVAITHNVVGLQHATMAIYNAWCDRVPIIVLGGTGPMDAMRRRPWIEWVHTALVQGNLVRDFVKWDDQPFSVEAIPESLLRAYQQAVSAPSGPVYVCFDVALQEDPLPGPIAVPAARDYALPSSPSADPAIVRTVADRLVDARFPVIIADYVGRSPAAFEALVALAETLGAAVLDRGGRFSFPTNHPLNLSGLAPEVLPRADVILALDVADLHGALGVAERRTHGSRRYLPNAEAQIINISLNHLITRSWPADYQRLQPTDMTITADTAVLLPALGQEVKDRLVGNAAKREATQSRAQEIAARHAALRQQWRDRARELRDRRPISAARLAEEICEAVRGHDWLLTHNDLGGWVPHLADMSKPGQRSGSSSGAGLGYGPGASLGIALAHRGTGKLCVNIQPDGDFLFTPSALWTAAHHNIPLLTVMWNNKTYSNSEMHQRQVATQRGRSVEASSTGTLLEDPDVDFASLARSFGVEARGPITDPDDLAAALRWGIEVVLEGRKPALVDVRAEKS